MVQRIALLLASSALLISGCTVSSRPLSSLFGAAGCSYKESIYSHGSTTCQSGTQYRCDDGQWKGWGTLCAENAPVADKGCELNGNSYSTGSVRCQSGTEYRCDDGAWRNLARTCTDGSADSAGVAPASRTCLYNGATLATQSTICKSGITFLCQDGEWRNLGSACQ